MSKAPNMVSSQCVYIPHHPVIRESSLTTRLRVVFNASSLTINMTSLNNHLLTGPKLQTNLSAVILRWRQYRYVYSADIAKMYRQIRVDPRDIDYQRILWTENQNEKAQPYQLTTVTYGTACAPFLALCVIRQLVHDEGHSFPMAASVLQENIYVDDVLFGADDIPFLRQLRTQVCALLNRGQFDLRKWSSNSAKLLSDIDPEDHGLACSKTLQTDDYLKILGLIWDPLVDAFKFRVNLPKSSSKTKHSILADIAKFFDPLGWGTPATITAKIFLQQLWQLKIDWDDIIPDSLLKQWETLQQSLADFNDLQMNRWIQKGSDTAHCELHGFADASTKAYAAAIYIRLVSLAGETTSMLLVGKSKVAPIKSLSVPRLELTAAVLLSRLLEFVRSSLNLYMIPCYCWTDSTVVLAWLAQHPSKWKTFVSNRVSEIQSRVPFASWRHVATEENPADCASRGITGSQLASHQLWWHGPAWLRSPASEWPSPIKSPPPETSLEINSRLTTHLTQSVEPWDLATRFSSWPKLIRVTAYAKSSQQQFWPILGSIIPYDNVFMIGLYQGNEKPEDVNDFLKDFVNEATEICQNGININGQHIACRIGALICDTPAKSFVLCIKGHSGYSSCTKCTTEGEYVGNRMCFPQLDAPLRTDDNFVQKIDDSYHKPGTTCSLLRIPYFKPVTNVPLDYMHLICLGIMRKLLNLWLNGELKYRLQHRAVNEISSRLMLLKPSIPVEFARKPRTLDSVKLWKVTEYRLILLYTGPLAFKSILKKNVYIHFMTLHVIVRILSSMDLHEHLNYAQDLIIFFIKTFVQLYGVQHISHNVHYLLHLVDDVKRFGPVDNFSAFKFENYMQTLKKYLRKAEKPLQQVVRRYTEKEKNLNTLSAALSHSDSKHPHLTSLHFNGPLIQNCHNPQYKVIKFNGMTFKAGTLVDSCCGLNCGAIVSIKNVAFCAKRNTSVIIGQEFLRKDLFIVPCSSSLLDIYSVHSLSDLKSWPLRNIVKKYFLLPDGNNEKNNKIAAFPLMHSNV
ncbi:PREDICTED: uncharacterized protein LOC105456325 [Wasmannia auropunctata]|uniref:uncharacterized protein LOC105456325 n=1 Tax=Wasmannia auropunctata TaxID=64793 RepID=UPI0005EF035D|nr:PREDICTED: uncharacterized protein LOC105456325 [Wasmannia auropunctata]